jgi:hypothetical protein
MNRAPSPKTKIGTLMNTIKHRVITHLFIDPSLRHLLLLSNAVPPLCGIAEQGRIT